MTRVTDRLDRKALQTVDAVQVMNRWMFDYAGSNAGRMPDPHAPPGLMRAFSSAEQRALRDPDVFCVGGWTTPQECQLLDAYSALPDELRQRVRPCRGRDRPQ
jgi:hypothetical protein